MEGIHRLAAGPVTNGLEGTTSLTRTLTLAAGLEAAHYLEVTQLCPVVTGARPHRLDASDAVDGCQIRLRGHRSGPCASAGCN